MNSLFLWMTADWRLLLPSPWAHVVLCFLAILCGSLIGIERERKEKPTGTRTLSLACLGAAVFTLLSSADGRIAAQIITGVGFLGAGAIIHGRFAVLGLTSASTIWTVAAIGMSLGMGHVGGGLALCLLVLLLLTVISKFERRWIGTCKMSTVRVVYRPEGGKTLIKLESVLDEFAAPGLAIVSHEAGEGDREQATITYCRSHRHHRDVLGRLAELAEIEQLQRDEAHVQAGHDECALQQRRCGEVSGK